MAIPRQGALKVSLPMRMVRDLKRIVAGPTLPQRIPARVEAAIRDEQDISEILISLIHAAAIAAFAILYSFTPKAFPPDVPFEPVPVALAIYAVFTAWRTWLAFGRRLTRSMLVLSVVVDVVVLMVTIWSFHLQYQAPPAIYLKAPTLMYVFILIALRALRFEPSYVILCGVTAAFGWLTLVVYALYADPDITRTRDFAHYVMSYSILVGAEVDKIVSILMVTAILALALHRARNTLFRAALDEQAAADLSRFFAPEVAGQIKGLDDNLRPGHAELRDAAILFIDLRGFTRVTNMLPPAEVMALLSDYQRMVVAAVRENGGSIDKFMGDGILASFGATCPSERYAAEAAQALEAAIDAGERWQAARAAEGKVAPFVAGAMTTGRVMFGVVGDDERLEYTVLGDSVNLAAKLEKHAKVERVAALMSLDAMTLAQQQGFVPRRSWNRRPHRSVAGHDQPLDIVVS